MTEPAERPHGWAQLRRRPWLTALLILVNVVVYILLANESRYDVRTLRGYFYEYLPSGIWDGGAYSLLTANFIHLHFFHILFNMVWLWSLGARIELLLGRQFLFATVFFGGLAASGAQLATDAWPCIGASGVVYALFGVMLAGRRRISHFAAFLNRQVVLLLLGWMLGLVALGLFIDLPIGNAAHVTGFVFGYAAGLLFIDRRWRLPAAATLAALAAMTVASATWMPWSPKWREWRVYEAYDQGDHATALRMAESTLGTNNESALNLMAWILATSPDERVRDGERAIELARRAVDLSHGANANILDTLAAAYAEAGRWEEAERTQQRALRVLEAGGGEPGIAALVRATLEENLERIRNRQKIRE